MSKKPKLPIPLSQTTGRRKRAVARVRVRPGQGTITVNRKPIEQYFTSATHRMIVTEPLRLTNLTESYNFDATIDGGGVSGQAGAMRLGIARSILELDPELRPDPQEGRSPDPRRPREGKQEVRPQEGPQGAPVLEAVVGRGCPVRHRRDPRCGQRRTRGRVGPGSRSGRSPGPPGPVLSGGPGHPPVRTPPPGRPVGRPGQ